MEKIKRISTFALPNGTKLKGGREEREKAERQSLTETKSKSKKAKRNRQPEAKLKKPKGGQQRFLNAAMAIDIKAEPGWGSDKVLLRSNM